MTNNYCMCGCGNLVTYKSHYKYTGIPNFIHGHNGCLNKGNKLSKETIQKRTETRYKNNNYVAWNKGLTKENDERILKYSKNLEGENNSSKRPEVKEQMSIAKKGRTWEDRLGKEKADLLKIKVSERFSGANNNFWQGGKSFEPYTLDWNKKIRKKIKERDGKCMLCKINLIDLKLLKRRVDVHHIDYDKKNSFPQNLITLCNKCHSLTNGDRNKWKVFFHLILTEEYSYSFSKDEKIILNFIPKKDENI